jgi:hypothetical protein
MPRSRGSSHARRRPHPPTRIGKSEFLNYGVQGTDAVSGTQFPLRLMVPQRGGLVLANWSYGSRDVVDEIDGKYQPPTQPVFPDPLYRLVNAAGLTLLVTDLDARDAAVEADYIWTVPGFAYSAGDEEGNLALLYRSHHAGTGDTLFTVSATEHAAALVAGYTAEVPDAYVSASAARNRIPIYRAFKASTGVHTWVTSLRDIERLGSSWTNQGIAFYVWGGLERTLA